ncbi:Gfo/Idh/MocA family protein [Subtercola frigoramans]|uniref:Dehydrogenase n=1 Tax=Subtercola frigoramans TaxID=120298 RepID=A0ABS2L723_9MICO|nr:Gfo/Idh/MocA family oxidoreductase [Subtercola frigoramans]MBM7472901.1 putative dehydrogenase [Subtercola frigoramans]
MTQLSIDVDVSTVVVGQVRAAIIGTGFMGQVHARSIRVAGGVPAVVLGSSASKGHDAASDLRIPRVATTIDEAMDGVDVVHICTPNDTHFAYAHLALSRGLHVVCEKPLAITVSEAEILADLAEQHDRVATVPFVYRFHPMVREARARVMRGDVGRISLISGSYLQDWLSDPASDNWRVHGKTGGQSRAFADIGSHLVDVIEFVSGDRISRLSALTRTTYPQRGGRDVETEDLASVLFETRRGAVGTLVVSQVSPGRKNALEIEIAGSRETLRFSQENPESLWIGRAKGSEILQRDPISLDGDARRLSVAPAGHPLGYLDAFAAFVGDTYEAIRGTVPAGLPTFVDGLRAARVVYAVVESQARGTWVDVP